MPSRQQQNRVTLTVDGVNLGVWHDRTGGETDTDSVQYRLGGMGPMTSLGGNPKVGNVTLMRLEDDELVGFSKWLIGRAGKGNAVVAQQKTDDEGNPIHEPYVWTGKVKKPQLADAKSQGSDAAIFTLEVEVTGSMA